MPNKLTDKILRRIRSRSEDAANASDENVSGAVANSGAPVSVREAQFGDFDRVSAMNRRLGQGADSLENWHRLWRDNPALREGRVPRIGWVLQTGDVASNVGNEVAGEIVGFLGSIPLTYTFAGNNLPAAATCRLAVEPAYRSSTHLLVTSFFRQKDVDLFLNTTATVAAGKIVTALRAVQVPLAAYGDVLFWVLRPRRFVQAVLQKVGIKPGIAALGSSAGGLALAGDIAVRGRSPKTDSRQFSAKELAVSEIGPAFEDFWAERRKNGSQLFAERSAEIMRWHFQPPGTSKVAKVLACFASDRLLGYAIVRHEPAKEGLRRSIIADLMISAEDSTIVDSLLAAAHTSAKQAGSDVLEVIGFPERIRAALRKWHPYSRSYPACPYFYKARERALQEKLASEDVWYACPFDGDATLWP
jgi:hypothetical protein